MLNYTLALVTGASSGLGKEIAKRLASQKIPLILTGRSKEALEQVKDELQKMVPVEIYVADLTSPLQRESLLKIIHLKTPDLIINNAGYGLYGDVLTYSLDEQTEILETNGNALVEITIESARALIKAKKKGTILNVSSIAGFFIYPTFSMYAATKAFVTHFSRSFHEEVSPFGVNILTVCPGKIQTSFGERASSHFTKKPSSKDPSMTVEKAAELIWKQIQQEKSYTVIDNRYKIIGFIGRFLLPRALVQKILIKGLKKRYAPRDLVL